MTFRAFESLRELRKHTSREDRKPAGLRATFASALGLGRKKPTGHSSAGMDTKTMLENFAYIGNFMPRISTEHAAGGFTALKRCDFKVTTKLWETEHSRVHLAAPKVSQQLTGDPDTVAMKIISSFGLGKVKKRDLDVEVVAHYACSNIQQVATFHGYFRHLGKVCIVFDVTKGETLRAELDKFGGRGMPERAALNVAWQVTGALGHMHTAGVVLRDLRPDSIRLLKKVHGDAENMEVRFCDFGSADLFRHEDPKTGFRNDWVVDAEYADPLTQMKVPGDLPKGDVYALGVMLYELLCGQLPFEVFENEDDKALVRMKEEGPKFGEDQWVGVDNRVKYLVRRMLTTDETVRPTAMDVLDSLRAILYPGSQGRLP